MLFRSQTVAASFQAPTIFLIAQDLKRMQVDTNVDESDVSRIRVGRAEDQPDGLPIFVRVGRYGPFLEHGERRASIRMSKSGCPGARRQSVRRNFLLNSR